MESSYVYREMGGKLATSENSPGSVPSFVPSANGTQILTPSSYKNLSRIHKRKMRSIADNERPSQVGKKTFSTRPTRIKVKDFEAYCERMDADSNYYREFELLESTSPLCAANISQRPINVKKNRYGNILPFDHSRVILTKVPNDIMSDYINANFIPGENARQEYIACQGPTPETIKDFWRMIWEQNCHIIVMTTQLEEGGRVKCEQYWPDEGSSKLFDTLEVTSVLEEEFEDYTQRSFKVKKTLVRKIMVPAASEIPKRYGQRFVRPDDTQQSFMRRSMEAQSTMLVMERDLQTVEVKDVVQFHFTEWPDFSCPSEPRLLVDFISVVREAIQPNQGPVVVHCSAGVGRSGTFITVDRLMQHVKKYDFVDIFSLIQELRHYRVWMVQTVEQYIFVHECIRYVIQQMPQESIEALSSGNDKVELVDQEEESPRRCRCCCLH